MSIPRIVMAVALFGGLIFLAWPKGETEKKPPVVPVADAEVSEVMVDNANWAYGEFTADPGQVILIDNFSNKFSSTRLMEDNKCRLGINGSFYDENGRPLAWWEANGVVSRKYTHNNLLNGFVSKKEGNLYMGKEYPETQVDWGMQTGPVLMTNGQTEGLSMASDKQARRSVVGKSADGKFVGLTIFSQVAKLDGPTLEQLPSVVAAIDKKEGWNLTAAVNLDGGAASAFYTPELKLTEMVAVGSWLCVK